MLVVSPPFLQSGWGEHRPPRKIFHSLFLLTSLLLSLFAASSSMIAEASQDNFRCHLPSSHVEVKQKFLYIMNKESPVTMITSRRIPHRLLTNVVAIFLRQCLGYANVVLTYDDAFLPDDALSAIGYGFNELFDLPENFVPRALVNLELWVPPGYNDKTDIPMGSDSYLGVVGRLGWFFPLKVVEQENVLDHWRVFTKNSSKALRIFSRTDSEMAAQTSDRMDPDTRIFYCSERRCVNGVFTPPLCEDNTCAVLFASYFNVSRFLIDQILGTNLYVKVAWLGPNLNRKFISDNLAMTDGRSLLFFHYSPDVLIQPYNFASVSFPSCADYLENGENHNFCTYEMHRFHKFIWSGLRSSDSYLYESLQRVFLTGEDYDHLISEYNDNEGKSFEEVACSWMRKNEDIWTMWRTGDMKPSLYLVGLFPVNTTSDKRKFLSPGTVPAFRMAIDAINANDTILPDHTISDIVVNTECEPDIVMLQFIKLIKYSTQNGKYSKLIGIVGPACSDTVEPIAGVSKYFKMPIISYGAEGAIFSDREAYPYFFRTIPENKIFRHVYLQLFKKLKWARIASLTEDGHQYSEYLTPLQDLLQDNGVAFNMRKYPQERKSLNMTQYLTDLKKQRFTIIIGDFYQDVARVVMCEAFHQKMTGHQGYVWFLPRWFSDDWFDVDSWNVGNQNPIPCTTQEMINALQGHMSLSYKYFADDGQITPENTTVGQWRDKYRDKLKQYRVPESDYAGFTYDAVWTYAMALDQLFKEDLSHTSNLRSKNTTDRFMYYINNTDFNGVSGHIEFSNGPSRVTDIVIFQFTNQSYTDVGWFYPNPNIEEWGWLDLHTEKLNWPLHVLPKDGGRECIVEPFRVLLGEGTSCITAIIILCTISFGSLAAMLVLLVIILKHRYELKLRQMEEMWRDQSIFKKFEGWEIARNKVVINRKLGEGQFGTVYGGECQVANQEWEAVAVKTLKVGSTITEKLDFLSESEMMKNFDHDNIVKLLGVCTESEPIYTIMEFMLYGDLKTYLLARRNLVTDKNRLEDDDEVSNRQLTSMALDVAKALMYLADMRYVHRDVACRNCLVNTYRRVKLADFGMTRPVNENNYYRFSRKGMLPVRWMAPESLVDAVFTTCSDMWSYGVLLYEVITFGAFPFQGLTNNQVFEKVKSGYTLTIPTEINPSLELLLQSCWHPLPSKRVTAAGVVLHLQSSPCLISPSLDAPQSSVTLDNPQGLELIKVVDKSRKQSLSLNNKPITSQGVPLQQGGPPPVTTSAGRKRSMSGNMVMAVPPLTTSLSEDGMMTSTLDALNLNQMMMMDDMDTGEDPLLPPSQYISSARFISLSHKDIFGEREALVKKERAAQIDTDPSWTNMTPV